MSKGPEHSEDDETTLPKVKKPTRPLRLLIAKSTTQRGVKTSLPIFPLVVPRCPIVSVYGMAKCCSISPLVTRRLERQRGCRFVTIYIQKNAGGIENSCYVKDAE